MKIRKLIGRIKSYFGEADQNITKAYILGLSSIALLSLFFLLVQLTFHSFTHESFKNLRAVDEQYLYAKVVETSLVDLEITSNLENRKKKILRLNKDLEMIGSTHEKIYDRLKENLICDFEYCEKFFVASAAQYFNSISPEVSAHDIREMHFSLWEYKLFFKNVRLYYESKISQSASYLMIVDFIFFLCLLLLVIFEARYVFRPSVKLLDQALSARSDFISRISHEIRNPMNSILGMTEILNTTNLTREQENYLGNIKKSGNTLLNMLNNLVDYSDMDKRKIKIKKELFNIYDLVDRTVDLVKVEAADKGVDLFVDIAPDIPSYLFGDEDRLQQVLINLINNALKFTPQGYILLKLSNYSLSDSDSYLIKFNVIDSGIGIAPDKIHNIFNSFIQEDSSIRRKYGGSGLGLAICKEILDLMDSKIFVQSKKDFGSDFFFTLEFEHGVEGKAVSEKISQDELTIVLSESKNLRFLDGYLSHINLNFFLTTTVDIAENTILDNQDKTINIIIDDSIGIVNMIEAFKAFKKIVPHENIRALLRSNFPKENMEILRKNNFLNYINKPFRHWHLNSPKEEHVEGLSSAKSQYEGTIEQKHIESIKILAVDDSDDNLYLIRRFLNNFCKNIDFARNGQEAINMLQEGDYDIVFMDIQMPVMDGITAIKKIRKLNIKIPVYAVTGHTGLIEEKRCLEAGFTNMLNKPINSVSLYLILQEHFSKSPEPKKEEANQEAVQASQEVNEVVEMDPMIKELLPVYFESREKDISQLKQALDTSSFSDMKNIGHRIKGSAYSYGFQSMGDMGKELESAAKIHDITNCRKLVNDIGELVHVEKQKHIS